MAKLEIKNWKGYKVGDLFSATRGISFKMQGLDYGEIPVIAAARYNHGVAGYYKVKPMYKNAITISCNGVGCGSTYYHDYEFAMTGDAIVLLDKINIPDGAKPFIASVYDKYFNSKYSYGDKCSADRAEAEIIRLPSKNNNPDWEYMESYMRNIIQESEQKIENLRNINDYKKKVNINKWQEYRLGDLFYKCNLNKKNNLKKIFDVSLEKTDEFDLPLVNAKHYNNGIMYYGRCSDFDSEIMTLDIVQNGAAAVGDVYAQPQRTGVLEDAYLVKTYDNIASADVLLFLATVIQKDIKQHFSYDDKCTWDKAKEMTIHLPAKPNGKPDWEYMENYMKNITQESEWNIQKLQKLDCCK